MSNIPVTMVLRAYDQYCPLILGNVETPGVNLVLHQASDLMVTNDRLVAGGPDGFDVAEVSFNRFVIGMANETMNQFGYGYCAGVLDANPKCTVQQFNANSFADSAVGKTNANTAITNGADIVFQAAGATGLGVIEACQEAGVYAIGVDSDQSSIAPKTIITSAMKRVDNAVYDTAKAMQAGTIKSGIAVYDLTAGGVDIAPTKDLLPAEVVTKIEEVKKQIIDGKIVVPATKADFEAKYGDVYQLD